VDRLAWRPLASDVHFHTLVPDGAFDLEGDGPARSVAVRCPSDEELTTIPARLIRRAATVLARLATLVPPPRVHGVRYPGVLAPNAKARARVVPQPRESPSFAATSADDSSSSSTPGKATGKRPYRVPWADLLRRVFAVDVLSCPCGGRLQLVAFIAEVTVAKRILDHLGLDSPGAAGRPRPGAARHARPRPEPRRRRLRLP